MFHTKVVAKIKTQLLCPVNSPPPPENRAVYELMWGKKYIVEQGRPQMTIYSTNIACCIFKATNIHSNMQ